MNKENYHDVKGKNGIEDAQELKAYILNIYKTLMFRGIRGTYVYVCNKELRDYFAQHIQCYRTPALLNYVPHDKVKPFENAIPVYDLKAAAGNFSDLQTVSDHEWIEIPSGYKPSKDLFACTVVGESMNKKIPNGSICLFRKYTGGTRNGLIVLVEHNSIQDADFGSGYTVKEYNSKKTIGDEGWAHESITLKPLSYDDSYTDIKLTEDELTNLKVIGVFERVL